MKSKTFRRVAALFSGLFLSFPLTAQTPKPGSADGDAIQLKFTSVRDTGMSCLNGFAGYDITVAGREIRTVTYFDEVYKPGKSGPLTDEQLATLRGILAEWDTTSSDAPWSPTHTYCAYNVSGPQIRYFDWKDDSPTVPKCVARLVNELQMIVNGLSERGKKNKGQKPGVKS